MADGLGPTGSPQAFTQEIGIYLRTRWTVNWSPDGGLLYARRSGPLGWLEEGQIETYCLTKRELVKMVRLRNTFCKEPKGTWVAIAAVMNFIYVFDKQCR